MAVQTDMGKIITNYEQKREISPQHGNNLLITLKNLGRLMDLNLSVWGVMMCDRNISCCHSGKMYIRCQTQVCWYEQRTISRMRGTARKTALTIISRARQKYTRGVKSASISPNWHGHRRVPPKNNLGATSACEAERQSRRQKSRQMNWCPLYCRESSVISLLCDTSV